MWEIHLRKIFNDLGKLIMYIYPINFNKTSAQLNLYLCLYLLYMLNNGEHVMKQANITL